MNKTIFTLRKQFIFELSSSPTPSLDVDCLFSFILQKPRSWLFSHNNEELSDEQIQKLSICVDKRKTGLPIAYITNQKEFFGLNFFVNESVLIPKPDTELIVEKALEIINQNKLTKIADICTGSGCIGISIAKNLSPAISYEFSLTDISKDALKVAKKNAQLLLNENKNILLNFYESNLFNSVKQNDFDIIITNPPYVPNSIVVELLKDGRNEPVLALDGDAYYLQDDKDYGDGLSLIRPLIEQAFCHLSDNGYFLIETGEYNSKSTQEYLAKTGFVDILVHNDLGGQPRVIQARKNGK